MLMRERVWPSSWSTAALTLPSPGTVLDLPLDIQSHFSTPGVQQTAEHRTGLTVTDGHAVNFRHRHQAVRRTGGEGFVGVEDVVDLEVTLHEGNAELAGQLNYHRPTDAWQGVDRGR